MQGVLGDAGIKSRVVKPELKLRLRKAQKMSENSPFPVVLDFASNCLHQLRSSHMGTKDAFQDLVCR